MLNETMKLQILAVHAAVKPDTALRDALIATYGTGEKRRVLEDTWRAIDAHACLRQLARSGIRGASILDLSHLEQYDDTFYWQGEEIGKLLTLYKPPLPEEWQARIAYESFLDRFVIYLQARKQTLLLVDNDCYQCFFCEHAFELTSIWDDFIKKAFSVSELTRTFVALLNSVRLAESGGFSVLQVPIVSREHAKLLAGFYLASMNARVRGLKQLEQQIAEARSKGHAEKVVKLEGKYNQQFKRYNDSIEAMRNLRTKYGEEFSDVIRLASLYTLTARGQLKVTGPVVRKYVTETERLLTLSPADYYSLPPLLSSNVGMLLTNRPTGDNPETTCYVCGREIREGDGFEANKIILPSPSQALQSKSIQTNPLVCGTCASLAIVSPIKITNQSLVIRLRDKETKRYLLEDHLRMFVLGELNVYAGRYVMLTCAKKVGKDSLMKEYGREPYALWKVATLFPADVFRTYLVEAIIEGAQVVLPGRHLAWLSALMEIFPDLKFPYRLENDKGRLTAAKKSIRHIQNEEVIFAIYELTKAFMSERQGGFSPVEASRLEDLRALHVWWLEHNPFEEAERRSRMGDLMSKARLFRDVAGLTGILYAFATRVRSEASPQQAEREVEKLLEKVDEPNHFIYDAAGGLQNVSARLWRGPETHFIYDQAKALLEEADVEVRESSENGKPSLQVTFDDISKVYTYLFETRYKTEKDQREFTYQVKLSLYARFPEYLGKKKEA
ncbi:MAG TPA: hypothetical protein VNK49_00595 [Anaerolineales bacterium]|nr:hypothetical protein [Anaerolineales bacterium]